MVKVTFYFIIFIFIFFIIAYPDLCLGNADLVF